MGREGRARTGAAALTLLLGTGLAYGPVAGLYSGDNSWIVSAFLVVSLMHFWYDGFIWSARRNQMRAKFEPNLPLSRPNHPLMVPCGWLGPGSGRPGESSQTGNPLPLALNIDGDQPWAGGGEGFF